MMRPHTLLAVGLAAGLAGCVASRPPAPVDAGPVRAAETAAQDTLVERLARRAVRRGDRTLDVLLLSGGGQHGAYGTGFLRAWQALPGGRAMPRFDLVTGVSTGSLIAPFAVVGTAEALGQASALYRDASERIAPRFDPLFLFRRTGGVVDASRLTETLGETLDGPLCSDLAAAFVEGRQLAIGTVDLDASLGRTYVVADEIGDCNAPSDRLQTLFLATAAIPGVFPPVRIDGHTHTDGGVSESVRPVLDFAGLRALDAALRRTGVGGPVTVRVWTVMNAWLDPRGLAVDAGSARLVAQRANLMTMALQLRPLVESLATAACAAEAALPGLRVEFRATAVPNEMASAPGAAALFDGPYMARLDALGAERAASAQPWDVAVRGCAPVAER